jgi:hypothetical protein
MKADMVANNGEADNGLKILKKGYISSASKPMNIKIAILNPTEKRMFSIELISSNLRVLRTRNPGRNER